MPDTDTPVDQAYKRCSLLARLVEAEYKRARSNPTDDRYVTLGVIEPWERKERTTALRQIEVTFGELVALVDHLTILDMAASFERSFNARIATAVGAARKTLRQKYGPSALAGREGLVRNGDDFQGLGSIANLINAALSGEVTEKLAKVRENRNRFAHGTDLSVPPTILQEDARGALNEAVGLLRPV